MGGATAAIVLVAMERLADVVVPLLLRTLSWMFGEDTAFYCIFAGSFAVILGIVCSIPVAAMAASAGWDRTARRLASIWLAIVFVFPFGAAGNLLFIRYFRDRFYSVGDAFVDFLPYYPLVPYDESFGGGLLNGSTDLTMLLLWLATAIPAWSASILAVRLLRYRRRPPTEADVR